MVYIYFKHFSALVTKRKKDLMDMVNVGWLSVLPPLIAIVLALLTKEVIPSLMVGILSGTLIYSCFTASGAGIAVKTVENAFTLMAEKLGANTSIILFLCLLGALVAVISKARRLCGIRRLGQPEAEGETILPAGYGGAGSHHFHR